MSRHRTHRRKLSENLEEVAEEILVEHCVLCVVGFYHSTVETSNLLRFGRKVHSDTYKHAHAVNAEKVNSCGKTYRYTSS